MAFVFETVPQEDIEKYGLAELHQHYSRLAQDGYALRTGLHSEKPWMVDRERGIWFMLMGIGTIEDHPPMSTGEDYYILHYKGKNIEVLMFDNRKEGSKNIKETPFRMCWDILSIKPEPLEDISREEIIDIITEAMIARGYVFLGKQLPHIEVKIKYTGGQN